MPSTETRYTANELRDRPTLSVGQAVDLKIDDGLMRYWLSRMDVEDGAPYPDQVFVEMYDDTDGTWRVVDEYDGNDPSADSD